MNIKVKICEKQVELIYVFRSRGYSIFGRGLGSVWKGITVGFLDVGIFFFFDLGDGRIVLYSW